MDSIPFLRWLVAARRTAADSASRSILDNQATTFDLLYVALD